MTLPQQSKATDGPSNQAWLNTAGNGPGEIQPARKRLLVSKQEILQLGIESHSRLLFLALDTEGRIRDWNAKAAQMLGYPEAEALGQHLNFFYNPDTFPDSLNEELIKSAVRHGTKALEALAKRKDGRLFWTETEVAAIYDQDLGLIGFSAFIQDISAKKEAERLLLKGKRHFRELINNAPVFIWIADPSGWVTYANQTWQNFIGASFEGALGDAYKRILHPDDLEATMACYLTAAKAHQPFELECRLRQADGSYRWLHYSGVPQFLPNGEFEGFMGVGMDISKRKRVELALAESEARFRSLTDDIPVMIWMADQDTRIVHANKACCDFFGRDLEQIRGEVSGMVAHPDDLDCVKQVYHEAVKRQEAYSLECRVQRWDGDYRWVLFRGVPRLLPTDEFLGFIGVGIDITERKSAELALKESEIRFRTMADVSPVMIWLNDINNNLIYANKGLLSFFGKSFMEVSGRGWEPFIHPADFAVMTAALERAFQEQSTFELEFRMKRFDGKYRWLSSRGVPRLQEDGTFLGLVGTAIDITEMRETREQLEIQVRARTSQLEVANKELEAFSYSVSHDLRAPLRVIDGFSKMLLNKTKDKLADSEKRYIDVICENTQHMGDLIDDMLKLSRLSRAEMVYEEVDLGRMAKEILTEFQRQNPARQVDIQIADGLVVYGDANLLRVVMTNLLGNAWKYSGKQTETRIEVGKRTEQGELVFYIKDNGAGFDMKYAAKLFGAFQRLHRTDEFPGTGIGLATVQRVIHRHGGRVWGESTPGQGATFYFTVPNEH